jgi:hypothetical protein
VKLEIDLTHNQHALLMEIAAADRTHRSLAAISRQLIVDALVQEAAKACFGARKQAVASLVSAAGHVKRRK